ncbi:MAG: preprotein translocase subunit SecY [Nanoarchaeota archaeon]|nr:preprotein translocase subunit SecY [Nanoarchaeota archaeon]
MSFYRNLLMHIPEVKSPEKKRDLKTRLTWTLGILFLFLFLSAIPLYGIQGEVAQQLQRLELLFGASIGTLMTLGIGPIVTASIMLQLFKGAGILNFDMNTEDGKFIYHGTHKILTFVFIILQAFIFVQLGGLSADPTIANSFFLIVLQLILGGLIIFYLDEIVKKWGFGSGVSIFIAAGIGAAVFVQLFSPFTASAEFFPGSGENPIGKIFLFFIYIINTQWLQLSNDVLLPIAVTIALLLIIVFFQAVNVQIPLSFGKVRGQSYKWPLNFFYAGVIPVIFISAILANVSLLALAVEPNNPDDASAFRNFVSTNIFGQHDPAGNPISGMALWFTPVNFLDPSTDLSLFMTYWHALLYALLMIGGSTLFAYLWVQTAGMDPYSQAKQIVSSGLQIPGFRKDVRIIERLLERYIGPLTIMGGIGVGLLAAFADMFSALTQGTGILLLVMIVYQFYQQLSRESMEDFSLLRRFMKK